jgi:hypothetical protein
VSHFDWDPAKAEANVRKHGVSFDEAETVDDDPLHRSWPDPGQASDDARFVLVGQSEKGLLLIVITSEGGPRPRIISARRATKRERHAYEDRP